MPRWRTRICPAFAFWPAKSFTPRYLGCESLPNLVEPAALVVAITLGITNLYEYTNDINMIASIEEFVQPGVNWVKKHEVEIILALGVVLISLLSFAVGYLAAKEQLKEPIRIEQAQEYETGE